MQSSYYSGKQHTLHDGLIQQPNGVRKYIFHLSDDTTHDSFMTDVIVKDIVEKYPELVMNGALIIRSDNCSTQYKSRFVFANMLALSTKLNIPIYWFFGEAGHGRGLIDAMGWFGCKGPLRKAIIQENKWFRTAKLMIEHLEKRFENTNKHYHYIDDEMKALLCRSTERQERPI